MVGIFFALFFSVTVHADWLTQQKENALRYLEENYSPLGTAQGILVASPSKYRPDYYFHWLRDAALAFDAMVDELDTVNQWDRYFREFAKLSHGQQGSDNLSGAAWERGLGEPKFFVDGAAYYRPWGRPQNDGPALRVIALTRYAERLLQRNPSDPILNFLYDSRMPARSVIKADLEFIAKYWREPSFDLWEEVKGQHFYTRMVQRRALLLGAHLATHFNDPHAAAHYIEQARLMEPEIRKHWDEERGILKATLEAENAPACGKSSDLDVAVVLGALHGCAGDGFFCPSSPEVMQTAEKLKNIFQNLYPINLKRVAQVGDRLGTMIGRYPEDCYDGESGMDAGGWFLATLAYAELYYRAGDSAAGDAQMLRVRFHTGRDGHMSEQMNRNSGFMMSAPDLSWSYASFLTALKEKK